MFSSPELDEAAQAELDAIQKKLGKYKGKYGKDIGIDELEWVMLFMLLCNNVLNFSCNTIFSG